jgi:DNA polymerase-1
VCLRSRRNATLVYPQTAPSCPLSPCTSKGVWGFFFSSHLGIHLALVFDTETNGLLNELNRIHCLVLKYTENGAVFRYRHNETENSISFGLLQMHEYVQEGGTLVAHNGIEFDDPALRKTYPEFNHLMDWQSSIIDTIVLGRLIYPDLSDIDRGLVKKKNFPKQMQKRVSLEAWGHRLGCHKASYEGDPAIADEKERKARKWDCWNQAMEDYCVQDIEVTEKLYAKLCSHNYSPEAIELEHQVAWIIARQQRYGVLFDKESAGRLYAQLVQKKLDAGTSLKSLFPPFYLRDGKDFTPKKDSKRFGYVEGAPLTKVKLTEFNPGSTDHVALVLKRKYKWVPTEFTNEGKPKMDEAVLEGLTYPETKPLQQYFTIAKRLGQLAEGKQAWLLHVGKDGRIHGRVVSNGAVTGRMTHMSPNLGQVPAVRSPYGKECRGLFIVPKGKVLVGIDAAGLELRDLAGYMAAYDGGAYVKVVLLGKKEDGTDCHATNARAVGLEPFKSYFGEESGRDIAKTWFYAFIYGAGDEKLGVILIHRKGLDAIHAGKASRAKFMRNLPALGKLVTAIKAAVQKKGFLRGLDGRLLKIRSQHSAPNTLLQSAGAVQMKKALVIFDRDLQALGYVPGINYEFVINCHDEWQIEADEDKGDTIGKLGVEAIRKAGEHFKFRCPLDGAYSVGRTWADTH